MQKHFVVVCNLSLLQVRGKIFLRFSILPTRFFEVSISGVGSELFKNNLFSDNGFILERTQSHSSGGQKRPKLYFLIEITRQ